MSLTAKEALKSVVVWGSNSSTSNDEALQAKTTVWSELPVNLLLQIFRLLSPKEVLLAGEVCRNWHRLSKDELLWKHFLQDTLYNDARSRNRKKIELPNSSSSWFAEFQRIHINTPIVESQVLQEHTDEVLHVAFSHDGQLLASSSKDSSVILWRVDDICSRVTFEQKINFQQHKWEYVQFCEFNASDTLLLVSGVVNQQQDLGKICIYKLQGSSMVGGNSSNPYVLFGAWLSERCYISGSLEWHMDPGENSAWQLFSRLWANYLWKSQDNFQTKPQLSQVVHYNDRSVTLIHVARPKLNSQELSTHASPTLQENQDYDHVCLIFTCRTAHNAQPHQIMLKWLKLQQSLDTPEGLSSIVAVNESSMSNNTHGQNNEMHTGAVLGCKLCSRPDHCIETNGHIIGMTLSPDHQYLYVNCRLFQPKGDAEDEFGPDVSNDISLQVYSMSTYELVGVHVGHEAYTNKNCCFFVFLDVADKLVASGAENNYAHVWDRHFGAKLATLEGHSDVVNCVAFNPVNQEMLVSASDDHTIRVWKSRHLCKMNNVEE